MIQQKVTGLETKCLFPETLFISCFVYIRTDSGINIVRMIGANLNITRKLFVFRRQGGGRTLPRPSDLSSKRQSGYGKQVDIEQLLLGNCNIASEWV